MAEAVTRFYNRYFRSPEGKIAIMTMDNGQDYRKPNIFSEKALRSLNGALDELAKEEDVKGLMITGKPYAFAAGADLSEVPFITSFEQGYEVGRIGHTVMKRILDLPYPTLAAINGVALGGGLEIALYCNYRTIARSVGLVGFPECFLGLVPGWGGCTLTTRLLGAEKALQLIIYNALNQNRMVNGVEAFRLGIADRLFDGAEFLDESLRFLQDILGGREVVTRKPVALSAGEDLFPGARAFVDSKVHGAAPAPYRAIDLIEGALSWDMEKGFEEENIALGDLIKSRQCKASIYSFDLVNRYARKPAGMPGAVPAAVRKVGIVGAGLMASQLAQLFIYRLGVPVVMKDVNVELVEKGCARVHAEFEKMREKGRLTPAASRRLGALVSGSVDYGDFRDCDFVIEAVFEEMQVKRQVFSDLQEFVRPDAVLASNTSSLSIAEMGTVLKNPERLVGFHFFNPVAVLPLVEIIRGEKTDDLTISTAFDLAGKLKKTGILVKDSPAFLVNRILVRMLVECFHLLDEGASFEAIDEALPALGLPMAPFDLLAMVGPSVALHVLTTLNGAFGPDRFPVSRNFKRMVGAGKRAIYSPGVEPKKVDPEVAEFWEKAGERRFHPEEIQERVLTVLAEETDLILTQKVVEGPKDVDLAMILGAGWPFFMGGITMYLDLIGITPRVLQKVFFSF